MIVLVVVVVVVGVLVLVRLAVVIVTVGDISYKLASIGLVGHMVMYTFKQGRPAIV